MENCVAYIEFRCLTVQVFSMTSTGPGKFAVCFFYVVEDVSGDIPGFTPYRATYETALQSNYSGNVLPFVCPSKKTD